MAKKAVLIGINYPGTDNELKGCVNDVRRMHGCLVDRFGFSPEDIEVLVDTDPSYTEPTGENIRGSLNRLVQSAEPGDSLLVHYSGHGTRLPAETDDLDDTGFDECIVPSDMNLITDDDFKRIVCGVPEGCKLTILSDSCHSGGLISSAEEQIGESTNLNKEEEGSEEDTLTTSDAFESRGIRAVEEGYEGRYGYIKSRSLSLATLIEVLKQKTGKEDIHVGKLRPTLFHMFGDNATPTVKRFVEAILNKVRHKGEGEDGEEDGSYAAQTQVDCAQEAYHAGGAERDLPENGILLSGCQSNQTSTDISPEGGAEDAYGAFTNAILTIIEESGGEISNRELVIKARELLESQGFTQRPGLYCSAQYADAPFAW